MSRRRWLGSGGSLSHISVGVRVVGLIVEGLFVGVNVVGRAVVGL